jgi:predicted TIM-barrel fold metal-dependent hydrolase
MLRPTRREAIGMMGAAGLANGATYRGPIIDTHVHFYDPTRPQGVPWPPKTEALLYKRVLPADFREATKGLGVTGVVIVEASAWLEDNQWVLDLAKDDPMILGIVGHIDPATPDFRTNLARFSKHRLFKGLRIGGAGVSNALANPAYLADLAALADADLQLDVLGGTSMFTPLLQLSDKLPKLRIVIDHLPYDSPVPDEFRGRSNLYAKVSGVLRKIGDSVPTEVEPYGNMLDQLWSVFGQDRLIYASNWPVSNRMGSYATVLKVVREYFEAKGPAAAERYFSTNARAAYRLGA